MTFGFEPILIMLKNFNLFEHYLGHEKKNKKMEKIKSMKKWNDNMQMKFDY